MNHRSAILLSMLLVAGSASAAQRVFVASTGTDSGTCARTAPCRTFAYAITQASPGGELVALDTAGYGPVTVTFSISIYAAPGEVASITTNGTPQQAANGIKIAAGANDTINIRGLFFSGTHTENILVLSCGSLRVEDTTFNSGDTGIFMQVSGSRMRITVDRSKFRSYWGIFAYGGPLSLDVSECDFTDENWGIQINDNVFATITDSTFSGNVGGAAAGSTLSTLEIRHAFSVPTTSLEPVMDIERCTFIGNANPISGDRNYAFVRVANSTIVRNQTSGMSNCYSRSETTAAQLTNTVEANGSDPGTAFATYAAQ